MPCHMLRFSALLGGGLLDPCAVEKPIRGLFGQGQGGFLGRIRGRVWFS